MANGSPAGRLLAIELRAHREARALTGDRAAGVLGVSPSKISRMENTRSGHFRPPGPDTLEQLLKLYRVPAGDHARLRDLCLRAGTEITDHDVAAEVLIWSLDAVPPLLRTEIYARAVIRSLRRIRRTAPTGIKAELAADRTWQARLRGDAGDLAQPDGAGPLPPLRLACVLDESVLRRLRGSTSVMSGQLDQLDRLSRLPSVDLRITADDADAPALGPFTLFGYGDDFTDTVLLAGPDGTTRILDDKVVTEYRLAFEEIQAAAADTEESRALIKLHAGQWDGG